MANSYQPKQKNYTVHLNVYNLSPLNCLLKAIRMPIYHSGVEIEGIYEYWFGSHDKKTSGVICSTPKRPTHGSFQESIFIGTTQFTFMQIEEIISELRIEYLGCTYDIFRKNCHSFSQDLIYILTGKYIPPYVNRIARFGNKLRCCFPLKFTMGPRDTYEDNFPDSVRYTKKKQQFQQKKKKKNIQELALLSGEQQQNNLSYECNNSNMVDKKDKQSNKQEKYRVSSDSASSQYSDQDRSHVNKLKSISNQNEINIALKNESEDINQLEQIQSKIEQLEISSDRNLGEKQQEEQQKQQFKKRKSNLKQNCLQNNYDQQQPTKMKQNSLYQMCNTSLSVAVEDSLTNNQILKNEKTQSQNASVRCFIDHSHHNQYYDQKAKGNSKPKAKKQFIINQKNKTTDSQDNKDYSNEDGSEIQIDVINFSANASERQEINDEYSLNQLEYNQESEKEIKNVSSEGEKQISRRENDQNQQIEEEQQCYTEEIQQSSNRQQIKTKLIIKKANDECNSYDDYQKSGIFKNSQTSLEDSCETNENETSLKFKDSNQQLNKKQEAVVEYCKLKGDETELENKSSKPDLDHIIEEHEDSLYVSDHQNKDRGIYTLSNIDNNFIQEDQSITIENKNEEIQDQNEIEENQNNCQTQNTNEEIEINKEYFNQSLKEKEIKNE